MCRNIKPLFNFDPPATEQEIHDAALQYVRKISGFHKPSEVNTSVFDATVDEIASTTQKMIQALLTNAPHRDREEEAQKARVRSKKRFGK